MVTFLVKGGEKIEQVGSGFILFQLEAVKF